MAETWTRHERPDGHRSLWFLGTRWTTVEAADVGVRIGERGSAGYWCDPNGITLAHEATRHGCPVPTAADLAWLRGE